MTLQVRSRKCSSFTASRVVGWFQSLLSHHGLFFSVSCGIRRLFLLKKTFVISADFCWFQWHIYFPYPSISCWMTPPAPHKKIVPPIPPIRVRSCCESSWATRTRILNPIRSQRVLWGMGGSCRRAVFFLKWFHDLDFRAWKLFFEFNIYICIYVNYLVFVLVFFEAFQDHCFSKGLIS